MGQVHGLEVRAGPCARSKADKAPLPARGKPPAKPAGHVESRPTVSVSAAIKKAPLGDRSGLFCVVTVPFKSDIFKSFNNALHTHQSVCSGIEPLNPLP